MSGRIGHGVLIRQQVRMLHERTDARGLPHENSDGKSTIYVGRMDSIEHTRFWNQRAHRKNEEVFGGSCGEVVEKAMYPVRNFGRSSQ